jgi:hypothetical protein
MHRQFAGT